MIDKSNHVVWEVDLRATPLSSIIDWCLETRAVDRVMLVARLERHGRKFRYRSPTTVDRVKHILGQQLLDSVVASGWPGSEMVGGRGLVFIAMFDASVGQLLLNAEPELAKWLDTNQLPEDMCFFKSGQDFPVFVSVTHERMAWLISPRQPTISNVRKTDIQPSELSHGDKYFCQSP